MKSVIARQNQRFTADDANNIQLYTRDALAAIVKSALVRTQQYHGFAVTALSALELSVGSGYLFDFSDGTTYEASAPQVFNVFGNLPATSKKYVALAVSGRKNVQSQSEERGFLINTATRDISAQIVPMLSSDVADVYIFAGDESIDPKYPDVPESKTTVAYVLLNTVGVEEIIVATGRKMVSLQEAVARIIALESGLAGAIAKNAQQDEQIAQLLADVALLRGANSAATGAVTISGIMRVGQTLTAANSISDTNGVGAISYRWQSSADAVTWADIQDAILDTYVLQATDEGLKIRAVASFTDGAGHPEQVISAATVAILPASGGTNYPPTGAVTISGTPVVGNTLTSLNTLADANGMGAVDYTWSTGATGSTLLLTSAHIGQAITVTAHYIDGAGNPEQMTSSPTAAVTAAQNLAAGTISVSPLAVQLGSYLSITLSGWEPGQYVYVAITGSWTNYGTWVVPQSGTQTVSLLIGPVQSGITGTARIIANYESSPTVTADSQTFTISAASSGGSTNSGPTGTVTISGTPVVGNTLTALNTLADANGMGAVSYSWSTGATGSTLLLTSAHIGQAITVTAHYIDGAGTPEQMTSSPTALVSAAQVAGSLTISGVAMVSETLSLSVSDGNGISSTPNYYWVFESSADGATNWAYLAGTELGGGNTYTIVDSDVGRVIRAKATYTDGLGVRETVVATTGAVAAWSPTGTLVATKTGYTNPAGGVPYATFGLSLSGLSDPTGGTIAYSIPDTSNASFDIQGGLVSVYGNGTPQITVSVEVSNGIETVVRTVTVAV